MATRTLVVSSPCVGLNAPERAGKELGVDWKSDDMFDLRPELRNVLADLAGDIKHVQVGPITGNLMSIPLDQIEDAEGVITGLRKSCACNRQLETNWSKLICRVVGSNVLPKREALCAHLDGFDCVRFISADCPPCQPVSTIGFKQSRTDPRADVLVRLGFQF